MGDDIQHLMMVASRQVYEEETNKDTLFDS